MASLADDMTGGEVSEEQYYRSPDGAFWWKNKRGEWIGRPQSDFKLKLKAEGKCTTVMDGEKMSELERDFLLVSAENGVDYAGLISGWKPGYYERDGTRYLISREIPALTPNEDWQDALEDFPNILHLIYSVFDGADEHFDPPEIAQSTLFLAWWRHAFRNLRNRSDDTGLRGLALVLAGDAGCGKTLMKEFIRISFGGKEAQPYRWFTGQEQFNGNLMQSPLWTVDDEQADTGIKARNHFGAKLKLCVANAGVPFRAMHRDELTLYPFRRIVVCVNREPERLMVLPPLEGDVKDKMLIFKCYTNDICTGLRTKSGAEKAAFFQQIVKELPHFLHWLCNDWEPPEGIEIAGRFGVPDYCHAEIGRELFTLSPNQRLWDLIRKYVDHVSPMGMRPVWSGGAKKLHSGMTGENSPLSKKDIEQVPAWNWLGQKMKQLQKQYPDALEFKRAHSSNEWKIDLSNYIDWQSEESFDA